MIKKYKIYYEEYIGYEHELWAENEQTARKKFQEGVINGTIENETAEVYQYEVMEIGHE